MGKENGLTLLLDAETYDYSYHHTSTEGFKVAVQHHLDQPLMSIMELDIAPGFESQIAVTPVLYDTTQAAKERRVVVVDCFTALSEYAECRTHTYYVRVCV